MGPSSEYAQELENGPKFLAPSVNRLNFVDGVFTVRHVQGAPTIEVPIFYPNSIRVGCTETTVEALRELLKQWSAEIHGI